MPAMVSFLLKHDSERENRTNEETKTINRELNVTSLTALHVLGKSLVELHSRGEQLDLIGNFVTAFVFFIYSGRLRVEDRRDVASSKMPKLPLENSFI
jgi:hypothetical protein